MYPSLIQKDRSPFVSTNISDSNDGDDNAGGVLRNDGGDGGVHDGDARVYVQPPLLLW